MSMMWVPAPSPYMTRCPKSRYTQNEDFIADTGGISLLENVEIDTVLEELNDAVEFLLSWTGGASV